MSKESAKLNANLTKTLKSIWLGKWFLFQTFKELDGVKDKEMEAQQARQLLEETEKGKI